MFAKGFYRGEPAYLAQSDTLGAAVLPRLGGKVASFYHRGRSFELLFQNPAPVYRKAAWGDAFASFDASGFDDAFPNIDAEEITLGGGRLRYPDHGEVWSAALHARAESDGSLRLWFESAHFPYRFEKRLRLIDDALRIEYHIVHTGGEAFPCFWAMHCLLRCEADMRLLFPASEAGGTAEVENALQSAALGEKGRIHPFPETCTPQGEPFRLDRVRPASAGSCEKYYLRGRVGEGRCGAYYPGNGILFTAEYDPRILPYLGFWVTEGGFRGDYNCALEPCNGYYDAVSVAVKNGAVCRLGPGNSLDFALTLRLTAVE